MLVCAIVITDNETLTYEQRHDSNLLIRSFLLGLGAFRGFQVPTQERKVRETMTKKACWASIALLLDKNTVSGSISCNCVLGMQYSHERVILLFYPNLRTP